MTDISQLSMQTPMDISTGSVEILTDVSGYETEEDQKNIAADIVGSALAPIEPSTSDSVAAIAGSSIAPIETSTKDLAAAIVGSAITKALSKVPNTLTVT